MATAPRVLTAAEVAALLDMRSCIAAVEDAFRGRGEGRPSASGVLGLEVERGGFHAKLAALDLSRPYFVAKINGNFPRNPLEHGLPTIQGMLLLFDAESGTPLAVMDAAVITTMRTAAASAVAADRLAIRDASTVAIAGCGVQARAHLTALCKVRPITRVFAFDADNAAAARFALEAAESHGLHAEAALVLRDASRQAQIIVTATPSRRAFLGPEDVSPGTFVAAVGADSEHKQEIDPALLAGAAVVVDDLDQCTRIGDLHHALTAGVMQLADVRASLDQVVAQTKTVRQSDDDIIIFDSTGVAIEDLAAAALVYERASATAGRPS